MPKIRRKREEKWRAKDDGLLEKQEEERTEDQKNMGGAQRRVRVVK